MVVIRENAPGAVTVEVPSGWFPPVMESIVYNRSVDCALADGLDVSIRCEPHKEVSPTAFVAVSVCINEVGMYMGFREEDLDRLILALQNAKVELTKVTGAKSG